MFTAETLAAVGVLAVATAIATDFVQLPFAAFSSPLAIFVLVVASLGAFNTYPAAGLALFLLTAVLFYKRNAAAALGAFSAKSSYGDASIPAESMGAAVPFGSAMSQPRNYNQFNETDPANPMLGPVREGFATANGVADEPEAFGKASDAAPVGSYPIDEARPSSTPEARDYVYRPEPETGSNDFVRFGPDMDEKKAAFGY